MILKGHVSTADNPNKKARIVFKDMDNSITAELPVSPQVGNLIVGDMVAVAMFSKNMNDGLVIAKF